MLHVLYCQRHCLWRSHEMRLPDMAKAPLCVAITLPVAFPNPLQLLDHHIPAMSIYSHSPCKQDKHHSALFIRSSGHIDHHL